VWTSPALIAAYLGDTVDPADAYLATCAAAADAFARRRRAAAGYADDPDPASSAPTPDVELGTTMYGGVLFRERGSADSFASFDETTGFTTTGAWPRVKQLLGIGRATVDHVDDLHVMPVRWARLPGVRW
jgi:hypothetical protein